MRASSDTHSCAASSKIARIRQQVTQNRGTLHVLLLGAIVDTGVVTGGGSSASFCTAKVFNSGRMVILAAGLRSDLATRVLKRVSQTQIVIQAFFPESGMRGTREVTTRGRFGKRIAGSCRCVQGSRHFPHVKITFRTIGLRLLSRVKNSGLTSAACVGQ
jgi:hypothetical protein